MVDKTQIIIDLLKSMLDQLTTSFLSLNPSFEFFHHFYVIWSMVFCCSSIRFMIHIFFLVLNQLFEAFPPLDQKSTSHLLFSQWFETYPLLDQSSLYLPFDRWLRPFQLSSNGHIFYIFWIHDLRLIHICINVPHHFCH